MSFGESHGSAVGGVIDGCPAGIALSADFIQGELNRRRPGQSEVSTPRKEEDTVEILSGIFEGKSTGMPIGFLVRNQNQNSKDYNHLKDLYRPSLADYTWEKKYGIRDYRGGGRSSGRETIGRVAAGAIAVKILNSLGIQLFTYTRSIGPVKIHPERFQIEETSLNPLCMPDAAAAQEASEYLDGLMKEGDSAGGVIECRIKNVPAGLGNPVFEKLDAVLAQAVMSIGAVKAVEIGDGFQVSRMKGSADNDGFHTENGQITKTSNHAGGIMGGMSDGSEIVLRAAVKPTPSISQPQNTVTKDGSELSLEIHGRHDPVIVPRAVVVVESMCALTITDALFSNMTSRMDSIQKFYQK